MLPTRHDHLLGQSVQAEVTQVQTKIVHILQIIYPEKKKKKTEISKNIGRFLGAQDFSLQRIAEKDDGVPISHVTQIALQ